MHYATKVVMLMPEDFELYLLLGAAFGGIFYYEYITCTLIDRFYPLLWSSKNIPCSGMLS